MVLSYIIAGGAFNKEVECKHNCLDPDSKRRKLVSYDVKTIVSQYFPQVDAVLSTVALLI
jgi:hypothetical protein